MIKKTIICAAAFALIAGFSMPVLANTGPESMTLATSAAKKPAQFPHKKHQDALGGKCGECHHSKDADGKQAAYTDGMEIGKCESCHNGDSGMDANLDSFKDVAHAKCKGCHKAGGKGPTKCNGCHVKK